MEPRGPAADRRWAPCMFLVVIPAGEGVSPGGLIQAQNKHTFEKKTAATDPC